MSGLLHVKLWSRDGRVAYSDEHSLIGSTKADLNDLGLALGGATVEEVGELRDERGNGADVKVLEAFVLMYVEGSDRPAGVLEVVQDYEPVAATVRGILLPIALALGLALLALWVTLCRSSGR